MDKKISDDNRKEVRRKTTKKNIKSGSISPIKILEAEKNYFINHFEEIGWIDPYETDLTKY